MLERYARELPHELRASILPEDRLEALLALETPAGVERLTGKMVSGLAADWGRYLYEKAPLRSRW